MGVFMYKRCERHGGRARARRGSARRSTYRERCRDHQRTLLRSCEDRCLENLGRGAWVSRGFAGRWQRLAVGLLDVLSRDSATHHGNAAVVAEGDTCMARIRGARGDTVRTGLLRLFKNPPARSGSRKPPVNPAAFGPIASVQELWLNRTARAAHVEGRMSSDSDCSYRSAPCCRRIDAIPAC